MGIVDLQGELGGLGLESRIEIAAIILAMEGVAKSEVELFMAISYSSCTVRCWVISLEREK